MCVCVCMCMCVCQQQSYTGGNISHTVHTVPAEVLDTEPVALLNPPLTGTAVRGVANGGCLMVDHPPMAPPLASDAGVAASSGENMPDIPEKGGHYDLKLDPALECIPSGGCTAGVEDTNVDISGYALHTQMIGCIGMVSAITSVLLPPTSPPSSPHFPPHFPPHFFPSLTPSCLTSALAVWCQQAISVLAEWLP